MEARAPKKPLLRLERLLKLAREQGLTKGDGTLHQRNLAAAIGMSESMVSRFLAPEESPRWLPVTDGFVGRLLATTGLPFEDLFEVVDADDELVAS